MALQVKRAEKHLLEALYGHISSLGKFESDTLMEEDPDVMQRRAATKKVCMIAQPSCTNLHIWAASGCRGCRRDA